MTARQIVRWVLGGIIVVLFSTVTVMVLADEVSRYTDLLLGALIGSFTTVVGYYFGSSEDRNGDGIPDA